MFVKDREGNVIIITVTVKIILNIVATKENHS